MSVCGEGRGVEERGEVERKEWRDMGGGEDEKREGRGMKTENRMRRWAGVGTEVGMGIGKGFGVGVRVGVGGGVGVGEE